MKRYLFVFRQMPNGGAQFQEVLDQLLTTAAFDQSVSVLFLDDGVWQLKRDQCPTAIAGGRDTAAVLQALAVYDVTDLWVENESLTVRGLCEADLLLPVQRLDRHRLPELMQRYDVLIPG